MMQVIYREFDLEDDLNTQQWLVSSVLRMMFHQALLTLLLRILKPLHYSRDDKCTFSWKEICMYADNKRPEKHKFGGGC